METSLSGKRALITGAAGGIGLAIAEAFAREGAEVAVHARDRARAQAVAERIGRAGGKAFALVADLAEASSIAPMCARALDHLGGIDIVVNNAGVCAIAPLVDMDQAFWDRHFDVNVRAPFLIARATVPALLAQGRGGVLLFITSTSDKDAAPLYSAYNASKHAVLGFARCLAAELAPRAVRVNCIAPGWTETSMAEELRRVMAAREGITREQARRRTLQDSMLGEPIPPQAVADMAVLLASDRGRHITAQSVNVCGGTCYW